MRSKQPVLLCHRKMIGFQGYDLQAQVVLGQLVDGGRHRVLPFFLWGDAKKEMIEIICHEKPLEGRLRHQKSVFPPGSQNQRGLE